HVDFGSQWYREVCRREGRDSQEDFPARMEALRMQLPKRMEKINRELRRKAGFTEAELDCCESLRESMLPPKSRSPVPEAKPPVIITFS
ncbi:MAG: DUF455 family protein, partial [Bdellovibrionaceae bacterium]|nr:DUF455 family protein [Pseudobdellovibrionaceae bacterium]